MNNVIDINEIQLSKKLKEAYDLKNKSGLSLESIQKLDQIADKHNFAIELTGDSKSEIPKDIQFLLDTVVELMRTTASLRDKLT